MRIWDIDPGFLNDKSLLGEHRELHGVFNIITLGKKGYAKHPETLRWVDHLSGLFVRHELLVYEMTLRGFRHKSPIDHIPNPTPEERTWPLTYIDKPGRQYFILQEKYRQKEQGRIPLPRNIQELWARHKYSTMARSYNEYKKIGKIVAEKKIDFDNLSTSLVMLLRQAPPERSTVNAIMHMWGYVSKLTKKMFQESKLEECYIEIQTKAIKHKVEYLLSSTALSELAYWLPDNASARPISGHESSQ